MSIEGPAGYDLRMIDFLTPTRAVFPDTPTIDGITGSYLHGKKHFVKIIGNEAHVITRRKDGDWGGGFVVIHPRFVVPA
tara:strand:+ start:18495 stop:18731 length:237 start_codon:yes stop_codon:yes gene_type:complete